MLFGYLTLFTALIISLSAAVYSILGLTAIFAAAFWPIVIMGGSLEVGKIVTTLWLHKYWDRAEIQYKVYLCSAVAVLMFLTSMGVFGFLSKAHSDQSLVSGDVQSKIAIYDEKIKTAQENIQANRKALSQLDAGVDQVLGRSTSEQGADKAIAIRKSQQAERKRIATEIEADQKKISALNEQAAPIRAEVRKVEAEVGPIKYIAAMVYGDNPDANLLEHAVRWVIILIVAVFDPLALTLLLAATKALEWERGIDIFNPGKKRDQDEEAQEEAKEILDAVEPDETQSFFERARERARFWDKQPKYEADDGPLTEEQWEQLNAALKNELPKGKVISKEELFPPISDEELGEWDDFFKGRKSNQEVDKSFFPELQPDPLPAYRVEDADYEESTKPTGDVTASSHFGIKEQESIVEESAPQPAPQPEEDELVKMARNIFHAEHPDQAHDVHAWKQEEHIQNLPLSDGEKKKLLEHMTIQADNTPPLLGTVTGFGISFPPNPLKGDLFLRVDQQPTVLYKFNGQNWMQVDKNLNDSYVYDEAYIDHLIDKVASGEYDLDLLNDSEREQMALRLKDQG